MTMTMNSPTSLTDALRADEAARKAAATTAYRDALAKAGDVDSYRNLLGADDPTKLAELRDAMARLGLTPADVAADAAAIKAHAKAAAAVLTDDQRAAAQAVEEDERAAVRALREAAVSKLAALAADHDLDEAIQILMVSALRSVRGNADRDAIGGLGATREWAGRLIVAAGNLRGTLAASDKAAKAVAGLVAANPRLFGGVAEVVAAG